jgi:hypothetical protein
MAEQAAIYTKDNKLARPERPVANVAGECGTRPETVAIGEQAPGPPEPSAFELFKPYFGIYENDPHAQEVLDEIIASRHPGRKRNAKPA